MCGDFRISVTDQVEVSPQNILIYRIIFERKYLFFIGVFLIPYFIILVICGIPMLFMELAVGQYTGRGPIGALGQLCPLFKGMTP